MAITTISGREFTQDAARAEQAAKDGPVFITEQGQPCFVLLTIKEYIKLGGGEPSIDDLLAHDEAASIDVEFPKMNLLLQPVDSD
jgi:hypothetical protein